MLLVVHSNLFIPMLHSGSASVKATRQVLQVVEWGAGPQVTAKWLTGHT